MSKVCLGWYIIYRQVTCFLFHQRNKPMDFGQKIFFWITKFAEWIKCCEKSTEILVCFSLYRDMWLIHLPFPTMIPHWTSQLSLLTCTTFEHINHCSLFVQLSCIGINFSGTSQKLGNLLLNAIFIIAGMHDFQATRWNVPWSIIELFVIIEHTNTHK